MRVHRKDGMRKEHDDDCAYRRGLECDCGAEDDNPISIISVGRDNAEKILEEIRINGCSRETRYVPDDQCPIDYIIDMGTITKKYALITFSKKVAADVVFGRLPKTIERKGKELIITWSQTGETLNLLEIGETHEYIVTTMYMKEGNYICSEKPDGETVKLYLDR